MVKDAARALEVRGYGQVVAIEAGAIFHIKVAGYDSGLGWIVGVVLAPFGGALSVICCGFVEAEISDIVGVGMV